MLCPGDIVVADMQDDEGVAIYATNDLARGGTYVEHGFKIGTVITTFTRSNALADNDAIFVLDSSSMMMGWVYACNVKLLSAKGPPSVVE